MGRRANDPQHPLVPLDQRPPRLDPADLTEQAPRDGLGRLGPAVTLGLAPNFTRHDPQAAGRIEIEWQEQIQPRLLATPRIRRHHPLVQRAVPVGVAEFGLDHDVARAIRVVLEHHPQPDPSARAGRVAEPELIDSEADLGDGRTGLGAIATVPSPVTIPATRLGQADGGLEEARQHRRRDEQPVP